MGALEVERPPPSCDRLHLTSKASSGIFSATITAIAFLPAAVIARWSSNADPSQPTDQCLLIPLAVRPLSMLHFRCAT